MAIVNLPKQDKPRWRRNRTEQPSGDGAASRFFAKALFYLLACSFLAVCVYVFLFSAYLKIDKVVVEGNSELNGGDIMNVIDVYCAGKYLGVLPRDNYLLVSQKSLERNIMDSFKKIRSVKVRKEFPNGLKIEIEERKALLLWCSGDKCYLVDDRGFAYQEADFASRELQENHLVKIIEGDGKPVEIGSQVMAENMVAYHTSLREIFEQKTGIKLSEEIRLNARLAEDGVVKTAQDFDLLVNFAISPQRSAEIMKTFLDKQYKDGDLANLAYVDLRVENKIFYKTR